MMRALAVDRNFDVGHADIDNAGDVRRFRGTRANVGGVGKSAIARSTTAPTGAVVSGVVYNDANHNGTKDAGETGDALEGVYADFNNNGVFDAGDTAVATDANGVYFFEVPTNKAFTLRATSGYSGGPTGTQSATSYAVKFATATKQAGLNFGLFSGGQSIA